MGGVGRCNEKSGKLVEICTNFEELGGIWECHQILSHKIVVWGGGNSWKLGGKFPKKWSWGGTTISDGRVYCVITMMSDFAQKFQK